MGRTSANVRGSRPLEKPIPLVARATPGAALLPQFIDFFESISTEDVDNDFPEQERPAKRPRVSSDCESITIFRDSITAEYPKVHDNTIGRIHKGRVGSLITFTVSQSRPSSTNTGFWNLEAARDTHRVEISLPRVCVSQAIETLLCQQELLWSNPGQQGALWASADIDLSSDGTRDTLAITFEINWNTSSYLAISSLPRFKLDSRESMLQIAFPDIYTPTESDNHDETSPQKFYESAFVPDPQNSLDNSLEILSLDSKLYPFQRRAVQWLLKREGVQWCPGAIGEYCNVQPIPKDSSKLPTSFIETKDVDGGVCYVSQLFNVITKDIAPFQRLEDQIRGGILAEEMGLGKTVEIIGLVLLHTRPAEPPLVFDPYTGTQVKPTSATLIVAPKALKDQWLSELSRHAPQLRVMYYTGIGKSAKDQASEEALITELASHDVVITTYNVLSAELDFAIPPPDRARRAPRQYHRPKSPLTQLSWWRICIDEAQMIESGVTKAATVARLIPRVNAWGVTGTPVKDSVEDLRGLLLFLRYEPFASSVQAWKTLIRHHSDSFRELFGQLSLRHTKRLVRNEISIPPQKRFVITMPFTAVEEQHYQNLFEFMAQSCGLNTQGEPLSEDWNPEDPATLEAMRTALDRLRQTALHPEVGQRNRRALGHRNGPMRTVAEVLDAMIEQSEISIRTDQRAFLSIRLSQGQLLENSPRVREALAIWEEVLESSNSIVSECREQLQHELEQAQASKNDGAQSQEDKDEKEDDIDETMTGRLGDARRRLRSALEIQHKAVFFIASAHYQIKTHEDLTKPDSEEFQRLEKLEVDGYNLAMKLRKEILQESYRKAAQSMQDIADSASEQTFITIPDFKNLPRKGIESRSIIEELEELGIALNNQANQLDDWREHLVQLLLKPLVDEEDQDKEITGEEYEESTKLQEELVVYVQAVRTTIADRQDALSGQINELVRHETSVSIRQAKDGLGPFPEKLLELLHVCGFIKPHPNLGSLRGIVSKLRALSLKLRHDATLGNARAQMELDIVVEQLQLTQTQLSEHQKVATTLEQEMDRFTTAMNARVEYYRQLQVVSDSLEPYNGPKTEAAMLALSTDEEQLRKKLGQAESKHRYLLHLKEVDSKTDEQRMCVICQSTFTVGVLTVCGHQFCKDCIMLWFKAHRTCPVCKRRLQANNLHDITLKPQELRVHTEVTGPVPTEDPHRSPGSKKSTIYSEFSSEKLAEIKNIDLDGPAFTTKIDNLIRHLLWLRESDPGAKSIIFSQYHDFLNVLAMAFSRYRIGFTSFDKPNGPTKFKEDPSIECFLLHARAHASGLNLVNASHVFLCEPLVNTALELQAIARVHRIGQEQETTVWLYIVDGTVEESIYNLSVQRRMDHIDSTRNQKSKQSTPELLDVNLEAANSIELEHASLSKLMGKGKTAGEAVDKYDLWDCLFGHVARASEDRLRNNTTVRGFLAAEAAEERRKNQPLRLVHGL